MRCFNWKNSREPWVASPSDTMRALPTTFLSGSMSAKPCPASGVARRIALLRTHSVTGAAGWAAIQAAAINIAATGLKERTRRFNGFRLTKLRLLTLKDNDIPNS